MPPPVGQGDLIETKNQPHCQGSSEEKATAQPVHIFKEDAGITSGEQYLPQRPLATVPGLGQGKVPAVVQQHFTLRSQNLGVGPSARNTLQQ